MKKPKTKILIKKTVLENKIFNKNHQFFEKVIKERIVNKYDSFFKAAKKRNFGTSSQQINNLKYTVILFLANA